MYLHQRGVEPQKRDEHKDQENPAGELEVFFGLILSEGWDSGEQWSGLGLGFGEDEQQSAAEGQVAEQELHVP